MSSHWRRRAADGKPATIEAVFMPEESRQTICISTQAGCAVDCRFCLTATLGLVRNLTAGEIVGQVLVALEDNRAALKPQTNIVLMGQGEPLLNYDAVMAALRILLDPNAVAISPKHATLSTSGIVPGIERLAQEKVRPKLAISLNASSDEQRDKIMPINRKYPLEKLLDACRKYPLRPWEHLTFEYVLLGGFNDSPDDARRVVRLLANLRAKVNLIPWNPGDLPYEKPDPARIEEFRKLLVDKGMPAFRALFARAGCDGCVRAIGAGGISRVNARAHVTNRFVIYSRCHFEVGFVAAAFRPGGFEFGCGEGAHLRVAATKPSQNLQRIPMAAIRRPVVRSRR